MLSRREKLLVQPWQDRRYNDHRSKVQAARAAVDCAPPEARPHVALKAKKWRREGERAARVLDDNCRLLQRLAAVMRRNRLDNHWREPPPKFPQKVGRYWDGGAARREPRVDRGRTPSLAGARCYACELHKMKVQQTFGSTFEDQLMLPSLNMYQ